MWSEGLTKVSEAYLESSQTSTKEIFPESS